MSSIKSKVIKELFFYNDQLKSQSLLPTVVSFSYMFLLSATNTAFYHSQIRDLIPLYSNVILVLYLLLSPYCFFLLGISTLRGILVNFQTISLIKFKLFLERIISSITVSMLFPLETIILPNKIIFGMYIILNPSLFDSIALESHPVWKYSFICFVLLDGLLTVTLSIFKVTFMRPLFPQNRTLSKIPTLYEQLMIIIYTFNTVIGTWKFHIQENSDIIFMVMQGLQILSLLLLLAYYVIDLPFGNKKIQYFFGGCNILYVLIQLISFSDMEMNTVCLVFTLSAPVLCSLYFKIINSRRVIFFMEKGKISSFTHLKCHLNRHQGSKGADSYVEDCGILKSHMTRCKQLRCFCRKIWKNSISLTSQLSGQDGDDSSFKMKTAYETSIEIDSVLIMEFILLKRKSPMALAIGIEWFLRNKFVASTIFSLFQDLCQIKGSLSDDFLDYYARSRLSKRLQVLYYNKNLFFDRAQDLKKLKMSIESNEIEGYIRRDVDLAYAITYKTNLKELVDKVKYFISENETFVEQIDSQNSKISHLFKTMKKLYQIRSDIERNYFYFNAKSKRTDFLHMVPYFFYLSRCENRFISSTKLLKKFRNRITEKNILFKEIRGKISDLNLMDHSLIMCMESSPNNFGIIEDVYGKTEYLEMGHTEIINKGYEMLLTPSFIDQHSKSVAVFMENPILPFFGEHIPRSFISMPKNSKYCRPSTYNLKIIPDIDSGFKFVAGLGFAHLSSKMYVVVNEDFSIDTFSINWTKIFMEPELYLKTKASIEDFSENLVMDIKKKKLEHDRNQRDFWGRAHSKIQPSQKKGMNSDNIFSMIVEDEHDLIDDDDYEGEENSAGKVGVVHHVNIIKDESYDINFVNNAKKRTVTKKFIASVDICNYKLTDFTYYILSLTPCDDFQTEKVDTLMNINMEDLVDVQTQDLISPTRSEVPSETFDERAVTNRVIDMTDRRRNLKEVRQLERRRNDSKVGVFGPMIKRGHRTERKHQYSILELKNDFRLDNDMSYDYNNTLKGSQAQQGSQDTSQILGRSRSRQGLPPSTIYERPSTNNLEHMTSGDGGREGQENIIEESLSITHSNRKPAKKIQFNDSPQVKKHTLGQSTVFNNKDNNNSSNSSVCRQDFKNPQDSEEEKKKQENHATTEMRASLYSSKMTNQRKKKQISFEQAFEKRPLIGILVSLLFLVLVGILLNVLINTGLESYLDTSMQQFKYQSFQLAMLYRYSEELQLYYSNILDQVALEDGLYLPNRLENFKFVTGLEEENRTDYNSLSYNLANFSNFNHFMFQESYNQLSFIQVNIFKNLRYISSYKTELFDQNNNFTVITAEGKTENKSAYNFYETFVFQLSNYIYESESFQESDFSKNSKNPKIRFLFLNMLSNIPVSFEIFDKSRFDLVKKVVSDLNKIVAYSEVLLVLILQTLTLVGVILVYRVRNILMETFKSFMSIRQNEIEQRSRELAVLRGILKQFEDSNYFRNVINSSNSNSRNEFGDGYRGRRKIRNYKIKCFCFEFSIVFIILIFIFGSQSLVTTGKALYDIQSNSQSISLMTEFELMNNVTTEQIIGYNGIKQMLMLGMDHQILSLDPKVYSEQRIARENQMNLKLGFLSSLIYSDLDSRYIGKEDYPNVCSIVPLLRKRMDLCEELDNKIAKRGIIQVNFRVNQFINDIYKKISYTELTAAEIVNSEEFVEFSYIYEMVYFRVNSYYERLIMDKLVDSVNSSNYGALFVYILGGLFAVSIVLMVYVEYKIVYTINTVTFAYQVLTVSIVTDNSVVKQCFLKLMRLGKKYFQ